jgi:hypothetical protein
VSDRITITKTTRHGSRNLHTFVLEEGDWWAWNPPSRGQTKEWRREIVNAGLGAQFNGDLVVFGRHDEQPPRPSRNSSDRPLKDYEAPVPLAKGVNTAGATLAVILDALHSADRHKVDLGNVKAIVSELGSYISSFVKSDGAQRRRAEKALYAEILKRCTTI